jgi:hexokinase
MVSLVLVTSQHLSLLPIMMPLDLLQTLLQTILRSAMSMLIYPTAAKALPPALTYPDSDSFPPRSPTKSLQGLADEVDRVFRYPCSIRRMLRMSEAMKIQYRDKLQKGDTCMLPSFCHAMPQGDETGTFIALDVGGSTFRVALVELQGRSRGSDGMIIHHMTSSKIDEPIRRLRGTQFFDWMAERIQTTLAESPDKRPHNETIAIGLTWSFPLEQTSHRSGNIQGMGKGFQCAHDNLGQDLANLLESACGRQGVSVRVDAIINDGAATLLSQAYLEPSTSMGLILGTGTNAAAYLPTLSIGRSKFGSRSPSWFTQAERVIVNTECSMFGGGILPRTVWDDTLNKNHVLPDFQPLEYMITGRYLGELMRLIIVDAVEACRMFNGTMPAELIEPYTLDTAILAQLEQDQSRDMRDSASLIVQAFGLLSPPTKSELAFLKLVAQSISRRAAAYLAVAIHAMYMLQKETSATTDMAPASGKTSIACNGSVILKYPGFKARSEGFMGRMIAESTTSSTQRSERITLEPTYESALFGAAVAVALAEDT